MQYTDLFKKMEAVKHNITAFIIKFYKRMCALQPVLHVYAGAARLVRRTADLPGCISSVIFARSGEKTGKREDKSGEAAGEQSIYSFSGSGALKTNGQSCGKDSHVITSERIRSIDILRGVVILTMIFVNDAFSIPGAPGIFLHLKPGEDGMTIADAVFPAFLFIVGLSMPFSLGKRIQQGESPLNVWGHVAVRSIVLLFIGFFMVNLNSIDRTDGIMDYRMWIFLMLTGVILFRLEFPRPYPWMRHLLNIVRISGILLLVFLAFVYAAKDGAGLMQMRPQWWGIIGLIGWAYLISASVYLVFRKLPAGMLGAAALLYCVFMADKAGMFQGFSVINNIVSIGPFLGTHSAICVSGAAMGRMISENLPEKIHGSRIARVLILGAGFTAAGVMLHSLSGIHPMFKISKLGATPAWGLLSSSATAFVWIAVYIISDLYKERKFTLIIEYTGRNALMAYIISVQAVYAMALLDIYYLQNNFYEKAVSMGLWRPLFFSLCVVAFTALLEKFKIRLKL